MSDAMAPLIDDSGFMPHGYCFLWLPQLLWTFVISDGLIFLAYFSIPFSLWYFARRRPDLPFRPIFVVFGLFVMACGTTHLLSAVNIWFPVYWLDAATKVVTAVISVVAAAMMWWMMPEALALPSRRQLAAANRELSAENARRREAEAGLRAANALLEKRTAELETANRELDSFVYGVSHDLRAPLRALSGFSRALAEDYGDRLDGEAHVYLGHIERASGHMGELIDGLLALSRSIRGGMRCEGVDLSALAGVIRDELVASQPERRARWEIEGELRVCGDPRLLELVMRNLLGNAWKYSDGREEAEIRFFAREDNGRRWLCVADNGVGFDMAHAERLFKPFQRLHRQEEFPGIGIGLATVERIVVRHGGDVEAEGQVGRGALFRFFLPAEAKPGTCLPETI